MKKQNQKGITLIALIITIIVMLILVGVTINVALNGGLFKKAETATYQTEASLVKEQLEIAKAIELANADGKEIEDYSYIKVENLDSLDQKTRTKFKDIILVNSNGDICYNPDNVTAEEKTMLEAIGIKANVNNPQGGNEPTGTEYSFTLNELGTWEVGDNGRWIVFNASNVWNKLGKDLYKEENYFVNMQNGMELGFIKSENEIFGSNVGETSNMRQILLNPVVYQGQEDCIIFLAGDLDGNNLLGDANSGKMTAEEFMNTYGNVEFRFVEASEYGL